MMQFGPWFERAKVFLQQIKSRIPIKGRIGMAMVLMAPALLALATAGWHMLGQDSKQAYQVLSAESSQNTSSEQSSASAQIDEENMTIIVDVSGAVVNPGIKELDEGARIDEALEAAGGFGELADREYVLQVLNLAQVLDDGDKLYIPTQAQVLASMPTPIPLVTKIDTAVNLLTKSSQSQAPNPTPAPSSTPATTSPTPSQSDTHSAVVNVNTASQSELDTLPGVGPATASKIVEGRPYQSMDELCLIVNNSKTCADLDGLVSF